ncbi:hypothetical protein IMSAG013_00010 [Clostridiales bacterium]|nr:hypothetical protein IMSAG013_00010 [Clostridiales bacterium]
MLDSNIFCIISTTAFVVPHKVCNMIFLSKYFITNLSEIRHFYFIYADKNHAVIPQQIRRQPQTGIHHVQPVGMVSAHRFGVALGSLLRDFLIPRHGIGKIILIHKVVAGVVRRIDIDHLHLAVVGGLQKLENFQIVALYVQVLRIVKVYAFVRAGAQGSR